jgi:Virulence factor
VTAKEGRRTVRRQLDERFQEAIDAAAMRAGLIGTDAYLAEWRRETRDCDGDLDREVEAEVERLSSAYGDDVLQALVQADGEDTR